MQINAITHWLDGSQIYGSNERLAEDLRDRSSGRGQMRTSMSPFQRPLLPIGKCPSSPCFQAGDTRVTAQPLLTILHTLFLREHNRLANKLAKAVPGNTDDFYYQQARRVVIAKLQHITYNEYLPVILGPELAAKVNALKISGSNKLANPAIFTEFSTAAFRMGHSQLKSFIRWAYIVFKLRGYTF